MSERNIAKTKTKHGALYTGIGLRTEDHDDNQQRTQAAPAPRPEFASDGEGEEV